MSASDELHHSAPRSNDQDSTTSTRLTGVSRRGFLKGAGVAAARTVLLEGVQSFSSEAHAATKEGVPESGPEPSSITLHVNGREHALQIEPRTTLAEALRLHLGMTGTKIICDRGACSGCTVLLDGNPINSCMMLAFDVGSSKITTIEGIAQNGKLHPLQSAFIKYDAVQCGFCTPGMVMSCFALLQHNARPVREDINKAISGNLCRCGTYSQVCEATLEAARVLTTNKASHHD
jgi:xanthine dehydrogenase YagT iron-sulfur-binding subunit